VEKTTELFKILFFYTINPMTSLDYRQHARARTLQAILFRSVAKSEPALEGLTRSHVVQRIMEERVEGKKGINELIKASAIRLAERDGENERWKYTRRHSVEVGFVAYLIASEAKKQNLPEAEDLDPDLCFVGGLIHDIGKTFLPMALIVKELGIDLFFVRLFEGSRMNEIERRVLRDEHISAGTRFVRLFNGDERVKTLLDMVGLHHVMFNGQGSFVPSYPALIKGMNLPFHARIAKTADFISAVLPRHYRETNWITSFRTAAAYAMAVSGMELDPLTVQCFLTGTHRLTTSEARATIELFVHPGGQLRISNYMGMRDYVEAIEASVDFEDLARKWDMIKVLETEERADVLSQKFGFPTLLEVSPMSIKNKYAEA
jgi:HD-GYP domain-containing protein (c-di-GMP phosphodiesterase class II)